MVQKTKLIELFVTGSTARTVASLVGVNKITVSYYFHRLRLLIYENSREPGLLDGEIEVDESYFGGRRKGKRGRGAGNKVHVFGLLKRNGSVYACIIPNARADTLTPIIREKVKPDSIVYTDSFRSYNALGVSELTHYRINHSKEFAQDRNHINVLENFWSQAKLHMRKYNGIPKEHFHLFLKECERRFNYSQSRIKEIQPIS